MNAHEQLYRSLTDGKINHNNIQIAYRAWVRQRGDMPEAVRGLLGGHENAQDGGLLNGLFQGIAHVMGTVELAYRRGYAAGHEEGLKAGLEEGRKEE